ncbi:META domain-containing protein [Kribbella sp. NPDC004875]|uniref:META domain-containing protein n=1 Tax=Kribbella sp. NPDC004875 TaxID=3364107 RepID=UPI0036B7C5D7
MNKRMIVRAAAGLVLVPLTLTACGQSGGKNTGGEVSLAGKTYLSTAVTQDGKPRPLAPKTRVRLQFTADGRLVADAGCNSMQSKVSTSGGKLNLDGQLAGTAMGCPGPQQGQDSWLAKIIQATPTWKLTGDKLDLTAGSTTIALTDQRSAVPEVALDGTKWTLSTVITGAVASHQAGSEKAWLTLNGERVTGSTGCNEFQGMVARSAGTLTFGELATTRRACAGAGATLESQLLKGLQGQVSYQVEGSTLKLRSAGGGLDFTATR